MGIEGPQMDAFQMDSLTDRSEFPLGKTYFKYDIHGRV